MKKRVAVGIIGLLSLVSWQVAVQEKTSYTVAEVYDGDTFVTAEKQKVRIAGVDAPELGLCGASEAKKTLEDMILNKKVQMKVIYKDPFFRLVSMVYVDDKFVNLEMLKSGWAYSHNVSRESASELLAASQESSKNKIGIFSTKCSQEINPTNLKCNIKGNRRSGTKDLIYHYPGCGQYTNTTVQLYLGDQWFCSIKEAEKAGYTKAQLCP